MDIIWIRYPHSSYLPSSNDKSGDRLARLWASDKARPRQPSCVSRFGNVLEPGRAKTREGSAMTLPLHVILSFFKTADSAELQVSIIVTSTKYAESFP